MATANVQKPAPEADHHSPVDPRLKPLLDHIACELAREYIRLMEAVAETCEDTTTEVEDERT